MEKKVQNPKRVALWNQNNDSGDEASGFTPVFESIQRGLQQQCESSVTTKTYPPGRNGVRNSNAQSNEKQFSHRNVSQGNRRGEYLSGRNRPVYRPQPANTMGNNNFPRQRNNLRQNFSNRNSENHQKEKSNQSYSNSNNSKKFSSRNISCHDANTVDNNTAKREVRAISFKNLQELVSKPPSEIVLTINNNSSGFIEVLSHNMGRNMQAHIWLALGKSVTGFMSRNINNMVNQVTSNEKFMISISSYLASFQKSPPEECHLESLASMVEFLYKFQITLPSSASDILIEILPLLKHTCEKFLKHTTEIQAAVLKKLDEIEKQNDLLIQKYVPKEIKKISLKERLQLMEPPESYRSLPSLPGIEDIHSPTAFIRPNIVKGRYQDSEHYLDVQYRLLREDYIKPLRDGIAEYLRLKKSGRPFKHCKDVRVYEDVTIVLQQFVNGGLVHLAYFKDQNFSRIKWEYSKRFLTGSLLCLSADNFESMLFAIVARRNPHELKRGLLLLRFENLSDEVLNIHSQVKYVVIETSAYFEAYRHNLNALLQLDESNLPMKRYIVEVEKEVNPPQYLQRNITYDFRPLLLPMDDTHIKVNLLKKEKSNDTSVKYEFPPNIESSTAKSVNVMDDKCWPTCTDLNLNPTQYAALKAAVTKEFAIIQGPPGTGKTYVGLRIAQLLLHNINKWDSADQHAPILVVCYTNHALDQFLEGILKFTPKIVRVGGRGQNEALTKYQLNNLKRNISDKREVPHYLFVSLKQKQRDLVAIKKDIDEIKKYIEVSFKEILSEDELKTSIPEYQYYSLTKNRANYTKLFQIWLGIDNAPSNFNDESMNELYLNNEEGNKNYDFNLTNIYKEAFLNIPNDENDQFDYTADENKLRNGVIFQQVLTNHISEIIEICEAVTEDQARNIRNVWNLDYPTRWKLYRYWTSYYIKNMQNQYVKSVKEYNIKFENNRTDKYELLYIKQHIQLIKATLSNSLSVILSESYLKDSIPHFQYLSLVNTNPVFKNTDSVIYFWLGILFDNQNDFRNRLEVIQQLVFVKKNIKSNSPTAEKVETKESEEIDSEGEADIEFIESQREIDVDEYAGVSFEVPILFKKQNLIPEVDLGWKIQGGEKRRKAFIRHRLQNGDAMSKDEAMKVTDIWALSVNQRWELYKYWLKCYATSKEEEANKLQHQLREQYEELCELRTEEDMFVCRRADVVGMTTTGAAKYRQIVQNLNPKIVIVEEAAEILESHLVTSLAPGTQQVILIGDHQQLRPSPTVHLLSVKYDLNVSLFERMVQNGLDCYQLGIQHRMRPEIAALLVPHIYEKLENHESVAKFENIKGVKTNMYFITHNQGELAEYDSKSKVNEHEAKFLLELCRYFILQGYPPSEITVLTTYSGQLFAMKKMSKKIHQGVKMTVVDNFQGEENEIILISFVRSNEEGEIGFLKISNRVCVALSRAKKGLFCIGNFQLLAERSDLWKNITTVLKNNQSIGPSLQLVCQNHPTTSNIVEAVKDFDSVPEGGCTRSCEYRLTCGHVCPKMCHTYDMDHLEIECLKPCNKTCAFGHPCQNKCFQECSPCKTEVPKKLESCGHEILVYCYRRNREIACTESCDRFLNCGHTCTKKCGETCSVTCNKVCNVKSDICGHDIKVECFYAHDINYLLDKCNEPCGKHLSCDHLCKGTCSSCHQGRLHISCKEKCKRILVCGHECISKCSKSCPPCTKPCENRCIHSKCPRKCGEPCQKCTETCECQCIHDKCNQRCGDLCDCEPCDEPCSKVLKCGHPCIGLCGEPCPEQCRLCNADEVKEIFFGCEDEEDARFICLEDCNHIFEVGGLAHWMAIKSSEAREIQMKSCPKCKTVIRRNLRFSNVVKTCLQDIEKVKIITFGDKEINKGLTKKLAHRLKEADEELKDFCRDIIKVLNSGKLRSIQEITVMENIINIAEIFVRAGCCQKITQEEYSDKFVQKSIGDLKMYAKRTADWMISFFQDEYLTASEQQLQELNSETHRLKLIHNFLTFVKERRTVASDSHFVELVKAVMTYAPFKDENLKQFSVQFKAICEKLGSAIINVSDMEKQSILKAMGLTRGHWYQCPRGHVYCITECGGAMQVGRCNECGEQIGGTNHSLMSSNRVATAMDGAQHSVWSDAMNMMNYRF